MTSQGSAYGRFRRALDTGNATLALAAAADLEHVGLADALELLLLMLAMPATASAFAAGRVTGSKSTSGCARRERHERVRQP